MVHSIHLPQTMHYGPESFAETGKIAKTFGERVLIISDQVMEELGYVERCEALLKKEGMTVCRYAEVNSEPIDRYVEEALSLLQSKSSQLIVALGGGSPIDTAKAVAVLATNGGEISDYMNMKKIACKPALPLIAIPTTAGTGSEVTDVTVVTNTKNDVKMMIKQPAFLPKAAIVDPLLTLSAPKKTTAATGIDALTHAIEAYLSKKAHPFTNMVALEAIRLIMEYLPVAYEEGQNVEARNQMAYAATLAGMAFSDSSVCLVHGMSRPIGAVFHVPHGISNAMLLPAVLEFSYSAGKKRLAEIGRALEEKMKELSDETAARYVIERVKKLCKDLQIPNLKTWGIEEKAFLATLEKMARDALESGSPQNNPRVPDEKEIVELYRVCYNYDFTPERRKMKQLK